MSPASMTACWPPAGLEVRLAHSNGIPVLPFHDSTTRLVGASAAIGPLAPVVGQVFPAATPVSKQAASQFGVPAMMMLPNESNPSPLAVTRPAQLLGL